ncbi:hypothetical protein Tco_0058223 [Tanacetum coccineum]
MADTQAEIILSQGLPRHIFNNLNQTSTAKEIWDNVEMLMQGSGRTIQQRKEDLFDEYERFRAIGNESIHDYFVRFHKLVNDMKITQLNIPTHQMNTKFVNNLPAYWGKYVTNVKQNMDISTTPYVQIYTHLKAYEPHAKKTLKKQEQSTSIVDPLAYVAHTTSAPALSSPSTPSPQPTAQSPNDALMATMTQIANLLSGFQKQFPPTNNQLRTSSNSRTHATVHDGHIVTEPVQRKAPGNNGNTGTRGKKASYAAVAFHGNLSSTSAITIQSMGGHSMTIKSFIMWLSDSCDAPGKKHLDFDAETEIDGTIRFRIIRKEKSIAFLQSEKEKILSEKKDLADSYLDEIKPKKATKDLHKDILGTRNPGLGYMAKRAQPVLYDADTLLHPNHHPVSIWDSEEVLVHQVVSMKKMNEKPGHVRPANDFYAKLNALMFVPQKELSGDQAYWLSANEIASQASKSATPGTPFVRKSRPPRVKPTSGASKTVPKRAPRNHSSLPVKSANARKVEAHHRTLNKKNRVDSNLLVKHSVSVSKMNNVCGACNKSLVFANHTDCLVMCDGSVNVKPHQTKRFKRQPRKEWKPVKRIWKPISKPVANSKPQWKPTGRHFSLFEKHPLTRIMESTDMPIELPPSASSSPKITMVSRFTDHKLSNRQAGSKGISVLNEIWKDKVELEMIGKEEEEAINKVKGEALKEKDDPEAFIFPIRFEGKINENVDRGSDELTYPAEAWGMLTNVLIWEKMMIEAGSIKNPNGSNSTKSWKRSQASTILSPVLRWFHKMTLIAFVRGMRMGLGYCVEFSNLMILPNKKEDVGCDVRERLDGKMDELYKDGIWKNGTTNPLQG